MSANKNYKRSKNLYRPGSFEPFKISRSKIDLFKECPRCFYLDQRIGIKRPSGPPFTLNSAVDALLKQEFDIHRLRGSQHPLQKRYKIDAVPVPHENLEKWRHNFTGIQFHHQATNLIITGAIDDLWQNSKGEFIVVEYKATARGGEITALDRDWQESYKRQMEVYQWLLRQNGFRVSNTGYFVYCNGRADKKAFDGKLEFDVTLIDYQGDDSWVEEAIGKIYQCLNQESVPPQEEECEYCSYIAQAGKFL